MSAYKEAPEEIMKELSPYIKRGEKVKVSQWLEHENKLYKEVLLEKALLGRNGELTGVLYITPDNKFITEEYLFKKLVWLGYYYELFFNKEKRESIWKALQAEGQIEREREEFEEASYGLDFLYKEGMQDAAKCKELLRKLPELRMKSNETINTLLNKAEKMMDENVPLNENRVFELQPLYRDILLLNHEKVKTIAQGRKYFDDIRTTANRKRKQFSVRFNKNLSVPLMRIDYILSYFKRVVNTYEKVLDLSNGQYIRYLGQIEKQNVEKRFGIIRNR